MESIIQRDRIQINVLSFIEPSSLRNQRLTGREDKGNTKDDFSVSPDPAARRKSNPHQRPQDLYRHVELLDKSMR